MLRSDGYEMDPVDAVFECAAQDNELSGLSPSHHMKIKRYRHRTFDIAHCTHIQSLCNNKQCISRDEFQKRTRLDHHVTCSSLDWCSAPSQLKE